MEERRSVSRWQINKRADLTFENGVKSIPCVVEDISTCGARVSLHKDLFPEAFSNFSLALDDDCVFDAEANVPWTEKIYERNVFGLSFNRIEESAKSRITQYVKDNFPDEMIKHVWRGV